MRIVILGPGRIGSTLARDLARAGHEVMLSAYRDEEKAQEIADRLDGRVHVGPLEQARSFGEVFFLCVPHGAALQTVQALEPIRGKVLVDCTNQFGGVAAGASSTSAALARQAPGFIVVKAFNTLRYDDLNAEANATPLRAMTFCSDSGAAAGVVDTLIRDCGFAPVNLGPLSNGVLQEPGGPFFLEVLDANTATRIANATEASAGYMPANRPE